MRVVMLALACGGCIPSVPFVVGETAEVLKPREVSAAVYGGGGAFTGSTNSYRCCGGVMARVRFGVGRAQEVGIEGGTYLDGTPGHGDVWGTGKLAWKLSVNEQYALVAGAGLTFIDKTVGLGGDAGVIASTKPLLATPLQLYAALRVTMMVQTNGVLSDGGGVLSGGIAWNVTHQLRLALEAGVIGTGAHQAATDTVSSANNGWFGGYGAALVSYAWRR